MSVSVIKHQIESHVGNMNLSELETMNFSTCLPRNGHKYVLQSYMSKNAALTDRVITMWEVDSSNNWTDLWSVLDSKYRDGDTISNISSGSVGSYAGCLTSSGKKVVFTVPVPREIPSGFNITLTTMQGSLRGINGYIGTANTNWLTGSGYTISTERNGSYAFNVVVTFDSAVSTTNNTPVNFTGNIAATLSAAS